MTGEAPVTGRSAAGGAAATVGTAPAASAAPAARAVPGPAAEFAALVAALRAAGRIGAHDTVVPLTGGVSSAIGLVTPGRPAGERWVAKAARSRLDVPDEWIADTARTGREALALGLLDGRLGPVRVPRLLFVEGEPPVLGMEWIGPPAANWKRQLLAGTVEPDVAAALGRAMAALHRTPAPPGLAAPEAVQGFEVLRTTPYYRTVAARRPEYADDMAALIADLDRAAGPGLVHGDFTPKNILVGPAGPILLDFEVAHAGDPAFDLGMLGAHLLLKSCVPDLAGRRPALLDALDALWDHYDGPADRDLARRHTGGVMLARLYGKSRVDYLTGPAAEAAERLGAALLRGSGRPGVTARRPGRPGVTARRPGRPGLTARRPARPGGGVTA